MVNAAAGLKTVAVHYKGAAPSLIALASGEVGFMILNVLDPQPFIKQGKLRGLATTGAKRSQALPDVPTLLEQNIKVEAYLWSGFFAVARTPAPIVGKLNAETARFLSEPKTHTWLVNNLGSFSHTPDEFGFRQPMSSPGRGHHRRGCNSTELRTGCGFESCWAR
jgi:tripartite-type tricarboxylate transporter receptor subunit TctC